MHLATDGGAWCGAWGTKAALACDWNSGWCPMLMDTLEFVCRMTSRKGLSRGVAAISGP